METQEQVASQPLNSIDLDADDTQKLFSDALNEALGKEVPKTQVVEEVKPEVVPVVEQKVEEVKAEVKEEASKVVEKTTEGAVQETKPALPANVPEWFKEVPEALQNKILAEIQDKERFRQWFASEKGRWTSWQRRAEQSERELSLLRAQIQKPQDPELAAAAKLDQSKSLAEWNALIEADPNLGKALEQRVIAERQKTADEIARLNQKVEARINPLDQHIQNTSQEEERRLLLEAVPNYQEVISSPVYDYWIKNVASEGIRSIAQNSVDHHDAVQVLHLYAAQAPQLYDQLIATGVIKAPAAQQEVKQESAQEVQQNTRASTTSHADKVAQSRQQKLEEAPVVSKAPNIMASSSSNPFGANRPGDAIDLDNPATMALFEAELMKALGR